MFKRITFVSAVAVVALAASGAWAQDANAKPQISGEAAGSSFHFGGSRERRDHSQDSRRAGGQRLSSAPRPKTSCNAIHAKPSVWFAAPFDLAGADESGASHPPHGPGVVTVGAVIAGKAGYATVNVANSKIATIELEPLPHSIVAGSAEKLNLIARTANAESAGRRVNPLDLRQAVGRQRRRGWTCHRGVAAGSATIKATADGASGTVRVQVIRELVRKLTIKPASTDARTGDVVHFTAGDASGGKTPAVRWSISGSGAAVYPDGAFVAEKAGTYVVTASSGQHSASASVMVLLCNVEREVEVVAHVPMPDLQMSEEWIIGHHAYLLTIADKLFVYDIADPANLNLDMLKVDARLINDISTTPDEKIGVFTREGASNRKNGIVFLDTQRSFAPESALGIHGHGYGRRA